MPDQNTTDFDALQASVAAQLARSPVFADAAEREDWQKNVLPQLDAAGLAELAELLTRAEEVQAEADSAEIKILQAQQKTLTELLYRAKNAVLVANEAHDGAAAMAALSAVETEIEQL